MFGKLGQVYSVAKGNWVDDPEARGATKMAVGVALIAEGAVGALSKAADAVNPFNDDRGPGGLVGAFFLFAVGAVFVVAGFFMAPDPIDDEVVTTGTVIDVLESRDSDGTMYRPVVEYEVDGQTYTVDGTVGTSSRPSVGASKEVAYSASTPENAHIKGGMEGMFHWLFIGAGGLVALAGLWKLAVSVAMIGVGIWVFRQGRAERGPDAGSFLEDLTNLFKQPARLSSALALATGGDAAAAAGTVPQPVMPSGGAAPAQPTPQAVAVPTRQPTPTVAPPPAQTTPPGWYPDPHGEATYRWWDGGAWTANVSQGS